MKMLAYEGAIFVPIAKEQTTKNGLSSEKEGLQQCEHLPLF
jgi:hypothetical protein